MKGVSLYTSDNETRLVASLDPLVFEGSFDLDAFEQYVLASQYSQFSISKTDIMSLSDAYTVAVNSDTDDLIEQVIGQIKPNKLVLDIAEDEMTATLTLQTPYSGSLPDVQTILNSVKQRGIVVGVSKKRVKALVEESNDSEAGTEHKGIIAIGLKPRKGKNSYVKPLVENALNRALAPQKANDDKVDMRNLGDISCVREHAPVARRMPPTSGRAGKTVTGSIIETEPGKWKDIKLGKNTEISPKDENLIIASVSGQPKFVDNKMFIDETYITKGVNIGTGNIKYDGAVIVNGDVTEHMEIIAKGDITINGFVESAHIRSGGDIIITEGATGKMNDEDCRIIASGSLFLQHGQGLNIITGKNLVVGKQLAYSQVKCKGNVTIGLIDNPMGNLFASTISCYGTLKAGIVGAVSGSALTIDFSQGYNLLCAHLEGISDLLKQLMSNNVDHEIKLATLKSKLLPESLKLKLDQLKDAVEQERMLGEWLKASLIELQDRKRDYEVNARVIANKEMFPGVKIALNGKVWRAEKECMSCRIILEEDNWVYQPLI